MDSFVNHKPKTVVHQKKARDIEASEYQRCMWKKQSEACQYIALFFCPVGIPFNVAKLDAFKQAIEAIGQYDPNLKPPSYHDLRDSLLKKELDYANEMLKSQRDLCEVWMFYYVRWLANIRGRSSMKFWVNGPAGTMFVKFIDASTFVKTREKMFEQLDSFVDHVREANLVQLCHGW